MREEWYVVPARSALAVASPAVGSAAGPATGPATPVRVDEELDLLRESADPSPAPQKKLPRQAYGHVVK